MWSDAREPGCAGKHELYRVHCSDAEAQDSWSPKVQIFHMISAPPSSGAARMRGRS